MILKYNYIEIRDFNGKLINEFVYFNLIWDRFFGKKLIYVIENILDISLDGNKIVIIEVLIYNVVNNLLL